MILLSSNISLDNSSLRDERFDNTSARATGVDLSVTNSSYSYANSGDEDKYRMFSSNFPILGFDKPYELYVVDTMVNVPISANIVVKNFGTNPWEISWNFSQLTDNRFITTRKLLAENFLHHFLFENKEILVLICFFFEPAKKILKSLVHNLIVLQQIATDELLPPGNQLGSSGCEPMSDKNATICSFLTPPNHNARKQSGFLRHTHVFAE